MRLFVAINFKDEVKNYLRSLQGQLAEARMTLPKDFHLTLKFLGEVEEGPRYDEIVDVLRKISQVYPSANGMVLQLKDIDVFRHGRFIRIVFVTLDVPTIIFDLQKLIEKRLEKLGFEAEHRFVPHVTLARVKYYEGNFFEEALKLIRVEQLKCEISSFDLMRSFLSKEGGSYQKLARFTF